MNIQMSLEQKQALSQRMIQSAQILQMSAQELEEYVENLALENPVIDIAEITPPMNDTAAEKLRKYEWLNSLDDQNRSTYYQKETTDEEKNSNDWNFSINEGETLRDYLWSQVISSDFTKKECVVLEYILESLDSRGYLTEDLSEIAKHFHITNEQVHRLRQILQGLDPAGVCARNLSECLSLQAKRYGIMTPVLETILNDCLDLVAKNQLPAIAKQLKISVDEVSHCCQLIKKLSPKPGSVFCSREQLSYIVPDVTLVKFKDHFEILLNEYLYPDVQVNGYYKQLSKEQNDPETAAYLQDKIRQAEWVRDCISKRSSTLMSVTKSILHFQEDFFINGDRHLNPLRLCDVAQSLDIHESTVSRSVRGKYLQCSWGVYPMNYFFSKGISASTSADKEDMSVTRIKQALEDIIKQENKQKPYSDRILGEELEKQDISISRRTVAKYRRELNIPDAGGRKIYN
ncbi:MAG: RNA polymerase factor sigma-54 [Clostridium sp.]